MVETSTEKIIYLVRHGQTHGNVDPVFQGVDSTLNTTGREQAEQVAQRVARLSFDTLVASPRMRTRETAEIIARATGKTPEYADVFVERTKPTRVDGRPYTDTEANALWQLWEQSIYTPGMRAEDGENFDDIIARADKALDFLQNRFEQALVVVTHGHFLRTLVARILLGSSLTGDNFRHFQASIKTENTGITVLKYDAARTEAPWRLWIYNDHAHLG